MRAGNQGPRTLGGLRPGPWQTEHRKEARPTLGRESCRKVNRRTAPLGRRMRGGFVSLRCTPTGCATSRPTEPLGGPYRPLGAVRAPVYPPASIRSPAVFLAPPGRMSRGRSVTHLRADVPRPCRVRIARWVSAPLTPPAYRPAPMYQKCLMRFNNQNWHGHCNPWWHDRGGMPRSPLRGTRPCNSLPP